MEIPMPKLIPKKAPHTEYSLRRMDTNMIFVLYVMTAITTFIFTVMIKDFRNRSSLTAEDFVMNTVN